MDIYDKLGQLPALSGVNRSDLPDHVAREWNENKSHEVVTLMLDVVKKILHQVRVPEYLRDATSLWHITTNMFLKRQHEKAWILGPGGDYLDSLGMHIQTKAQFRGTFEVLQNVHNVFKMVFDRSLTSIYVGDGITVDLQTKDNRNSLAYYLLYCSDSQKEYLGKLQSFVTSE